jgi:hypothetical protein
MLNIGLRRSTNATVDLYSAKFFEDLEQAQRMCKILNEENAIPYVRGRWKVIGYEWTEL